MMIDANGSRSGGKEATSSKMSSYTACQGCKKTEAGLDNTVAAIHAATEEMKLATAGLKDKNVIEGEIISLRKEVLFLNKKNATLQEQIVMLNSMNSQHVVNRDALQNCMMSVRDQMDRVKDDNAYLHHVHTEDCKKIREFLAAKGNADEEIKNVQDHNSALVFMVAEDANKIENLQTLKDAAEEELKIVKGHNSALVFMVAEDATKIDNLQALKDAADEEIKTIKDHNAALVFMVAEDASKLENLNALKDAAEEEIKTVKDHNSALVFMVAEDATKINNLKALKDATAEEVKTIKNQNSALAAMRSQHEEDLKFARNVKDAADQEILRLKKQVKKLEILVNDKFTPFDDKREKELSSAFKDLPDNYEHLAKHHKYLILYKDAQIASLKAELADANDSDDGESFYNSMFSSGPTLARSNEDTEEWGTKGVYLSGPADW